MIDENDVLQRSLWAFIRLHPGITRDVLVDAFVGLTLEDETDILAALDKLIAAGLVSTIGEKTVFYFPERRKQQWLNLSGS